MKHSTSRSSSRPKKAVTPDKKAEAPSARPRRTVASRDAASKAKSVVDGPSAPKTTKQQVSKLGSLLQDLKHGIRTFGYRTTLNASVWFIILPLYVILLHLFCTRDKCFPRWPVTIPTNLRTYVDLHFIGYGLAVILGQAILSAIPIGKVVSGFGYRRVAAYKYRSNGFLCLVVSCGLYYALTHYTRFSQSYILITNRFKSVCAMTIVSLVVSIVLWLKSRFFKRTQHVNHGSQVSYGANGNILHDLAHGSEVSPKIGETFDFSLLLLRTANFLWAVNVYTAVVLSTKDGAPWNYNVLFVGGLQALHILLGSICEVYILKSAFINQGVGFINVFSCLVVTPFCHTIPLRYVLDHDTLGEKPYIYAGLLVVYLVGLYLIFSTNRAKYQNAREPSARAKVLRTGTYALVRHPNYLGELLCLCAVTALCGATILPWVHVLYLFSLLWCRIMLSERSTSYEYKQYIDKTRSRLIPYIY